MKMSFYPFEYGRYTNFKDLTSRSALTEDEVSKLCDIFDNLHGRVLNNEVRSFNRGEYTKYYSNKNNNIEFKQPTSIILYWNHKSVFYFHNTDELIYIPKTLVNKISDKYEIRHHENTINISENNIKHVYGWGSKCLNNKWGHVNIIQ